MSDPQIYLASASPRRRQLLEQIGIRYDLVKVDVEEVWDGREAAGPYAVRLALEKAQAGRQIVGDEKPPVLGADTVVVLDGHVLGKPSDREHALAMLERLSGRSHQVVSAVAVVSGERQSTRLSISRVSFSRLTPRQQVAYWESGEGYDKAGAYAIQGRAAAFVTHLEGSYSGVMGLPLFETVELLREFGIEIFPRDFPGDTASKV